MNNKNKVDINISLEELSSWSEDLPFAFNFACWWIKHMPRGKGWIPSNIGKFLCKKMKTIIRTRANAKLAVDPKNLYIYCDAYLHGGVWDSHVLDACAKLLKEGDVFYDIGANAGIYSLDIAKSFNDKVTVHSFEAIPSLVNSIRLSIALNSFTRLQVHESLLGDEEGIVDLYIPDQSINASLISPHKRSKIINCKMTTLDRFIEENKLSLPTVIKIDVEGAEMKVFAGAYKTLSGAPIVIFEGDGSMHRFKHTHRDLFDFLSQFADYSFYFIDRDRIKLITDFINMPFGNFLALPSHYKHRLS